MRLILRLILWFPLLVLVSCKKYSPSEPAFFIKSNKVSVSANPETQGSGSNNITDLWLYVNNQFRGTYPVGNLMPIELKDGHAKITVLAGIKDNGISTNRIPWQLYQSFEMDTVVEAGKTITRDFTFNYNPANVFGLKEDFDGQGVKIVKSDFSQVNYATTADGGFEGKSLLLELPTVHDSVGMVETAMSYSMPLSTGNLYLEMDCKTNIEMRFGLVLPTGERREIGGISKSDTWKHVYFSLAAKANETPTASAYKIYFRMLRLTGYTDALKMYLDNIKLVYIP